MPETLEPRLDLLQEEYVLVQAWKKTAPFIRYHNWFSDTLALDRASVNLPRFIGEIRERLRSPETWKTDALRVIMAPKSEHWHVKGGEWKPVKKPTNTVRLRPLAHVSLSDQVLATALMLCLADRVETIQGDPRESLSGPESRRRVISYGHRLVCDATGNGLRHRWGSTKLYRAYSQDYQMFISRPDVVFKSIPESNQDRAFLIHSDLRQFYDRVHPDILAAAMDRIRCDGDDPAFFALAESVLNWKWHSRDEESTRVYARRTEIEDFTRVSLPQGLVASGFFANLVLLSFDTALRGAIGTDIIPGIQLADACRYVDDLRILITTSPASVFSNECLAESVTKWLSGVLNETAPGLQVSEEKTAIVALNGEERPLIRQHAKMNRIQAAVSGGLDALGGGETLDAIRGLMRRQDSFGAKNEEAWRFTPVPDVRDETVARFSAARFRRTFRSIRPLLYDEEVSLVSDAKPLRMPDNASVVREEQTRLRITRAELDEDAQAFALDLIHRWIGDPSNVRLLRIGLDLWPDAEVLRNVLMLLKPYTKKGGGRGAPRRVAWYCLAEVLRAGATETGFVADRETLPAKVDLDAFRELLCKEAARLVALPNSKIPWYLRQQALLTLAAFNPAAAAVTRRGTALETQHYRQLILFLRGDASHIARSDNSEFATLAVLARRGFAEKEQAIELTRAGMGQILQTTHSQPQGEQSTVMELARRDPTFLLEVMTPETNTNNYMSFPVRLRDDLCPIAHESHSDCDTLAQIIRNTHPTGPLRDELSLLKFTLALLKQLGRNTRPPEVITPCQVTLNVTGQGPNVEVDCLRISSSTADPAGSLYEVPSWCKPNERWRFQVGFLLRFILSGQPDFTRPVRASDWRESESAYRKVESHWFQRLYGLYSGQPAFGDDWLPITEWTEAFLLALLRWPGCRRPDRFEWVGDCVEGVRKRVSERVEELNGRIGKSTGALVLPLRMMKPDSVSGDRKLRACVVQTVIPSEKHFQCSDLTLSEPTIRRIHRNHLSAALAAVKRMLYLRETHKAADSKLDWLILPELSVHPLDVETHLVPFAREHKAMIIAGLTYQSLFHGGPLANTALWIVPENSKTYGLQMRRVRQGKFHLAPNERELSSNQGACLGGFRPCQWLIGYPWSDSDDADPLWLTATVCYDATDLGLAADLRDQSDVLAVPALNRDTNTFDNMGMALHYHMFQLVIVVNNGLYGGSNAYLPSVDPHIRRVFHTHGQPQAAISFLEIDDIGEFLERGHSRGDRWKQPPAGFRTVTERVTL